MLKNRLALSTVITTLIILVVAVLLAGVVTYFAINVVSTRVQQESLTISQTHVWVDSAGTAEAALMITNTGGRDVVINQIQVRGQDAVIYSATAADINVFSSTYSAATGESLTSQLAVVAAADLKGGSAVDPFGGTAGNKLAAASINSLVLASGKTMAVYIYSPDSVTTNDIGLTIGVTVFTAQAMYYQETNVQASPSTIGTTVG